jgi:SAM-dependent methyltransferase
VVSNRFLDEGRVADAGHIPYDDAMFDVVYSDNVLEHLPDPLAVFAEVARVLRPGGSFVFKTPNKWHYMPTIARLTPHRFHQWINRKRGRQEVDTFPTLYRANTRRTLEDLARRSGLQVESIERIEGRPEYLRMSGPTYLAGFLYERLVNSTAAFEPFRILLVGHLRRPL